MESLSIYGYRLGNDHEVEYLPFKKRLINHASPGQADYLRATMANLLHFLLTHAVGRVVADRTLQTQV